MASGPNKTNMFWKRSLFSSNTDILMSNYRNIKDENIKLSLSLTKYYAM